MLIDSHCHLDRLKLEAYDGDLARAIQAAEARGVTGFLCVAIDLEHLPELLSIADAYPQVHVSVGVHPLEDKEIHLDSQTLLHWAQHPKVVAIGETGLDYYYGKDHIALQKKHFCAHIEAARACRKPLIVHSRDAKEDTLDYLRQYADLEVGGVMHCFTGDWEMAQACLDLNFYISLSGIVTFKNADTLREVACKVPLERLLIETDAPYLAPVPYRGKPNEPKFLPEVAQCIADLRSISLAELAEATCSNYRRLFRLTG